MLVCLPILFSGNYCMLLARMEPVREERELRGKRFIISKCKKRTKEGGKEGNKARLRERGERN